MHIKPQLKFIPDGVIEEKAAALLRRTYRRWPITAPPVPVGQIAEYILELEVEWEILADSDDEPILAHISPASRKIRLNQAREHFFNEHAGSFEFTVAHEIGHHQLHILDGDHEQLPLLPGEGEGFLCRHMSDDDKREWQANRFASYLLMPRDLLLPAVQGMDLTVWPNLYALRDDFHVSISALTRRLKDLGLVYVTDDKVLHRP